MEVVKMSDVLPLLPTSLKLNLKLVYISVNAKDI